MGNVQKKRIGIAIVLATLLLCALFLAQGTTALLAGAFLPLDPQMATARVRRPAGLAAASDERADGTDILRRNIFDSETGDLTAQPVIATADPEEPIVVDPNAPPPRCEGSIRLVAALVNARHPEWSFASIAGPDGKALLYRAGMSIEGREIMGIGSDQVFMRPSSGSLCTLAMFAPPQAGEAPRVAAAPATPAAVVRRGGEEEGGDDGSISSADMESGINRVSDTEFTVARGLVDQLLENQAELMRTARIIPHQEGGRTVGVKLYGIRRNSLLGRLGLQNGDMLRTINGYDMTSPDSALEAYSRLRGSNNLTVAVVRRGQAMNIDYNIQ